MTKGCCEKSQKRASKGRTPGVYTLGVACQLLVGAIRSRSSGSPNVTLIELLSGESRALLFRNVCNYWLYGNSSARAVQSSRPVRGAGETLLEHARSRRLLTHLWKCFVKKLCGDWVNTSARHFDPSERTLDTTPTAWASQFSPQQRPRLARTTPASHPARTRSVTSSTG